MPEQFLIHAYNATSRRNAIFAEESTSAWLYLTEPGENALARMPIAGDAFVHNRVKAPLAGDDLRRYAPDPPPATKEYLVEADQATCEHASLHEWEFIWSDDGESVAVMRNKLPIAMIVSGSKRGYSRNLQNDGPWGLPWSNPVFLRIFRDYDCETDDIGTNG
jgi:hypothetical protein